MSNKQARIERARLNGAEDAALTTNQALNTHKLALEHVTPRVDQMQRGTCWDFATMGMLEHSYRANGVANGWLKDDEYLRLSEQACQFVLYRSLLFSSSVVRMPTLLLHLYLHFCRRCGCAGAVPSEISAAARSGSSLMCVDCAQKRPRTCVIPGDAIWMNSTGTVCLPSL